jgi:hypothetical protein
MNNTINRNKFLLSKNPSLLSTKNQELSKSIEKTRKTTLQNTQLTTNNNTLQPSELYNDILDVNFSEIKYLHIDISKFDEIINKIKNVKYDYDKKIY